MLDWDNMDEWKLLLVDDEPDNIEVVAESLEFYGMTVHTAENGKVALEVLESYIPDLILLDLSMPVMDGWQTLRQLKSMPETQEIPVLALSAHAILGDRERALEVGFNGYMTKPVDVPNLIRDLKAALVNLESPAQNPSNVATSTMPVVDPAAVDAAAAKTTPTRISAFTETNIAAETTTPPAKPEPAKDKPATVASDPIAQVKQGDEA